MDSPEELRAEADRLADQADTLSREAGSLRRAAIVMEREQKTLPEKFEDARRAPVSEN